MYACWDFDRVSPLNKHKNQCNDIDLSHFLSKTKCVDINLIHTLQKGDIISFVYDMITFILTLIKQWYRENQIYPPRKWTSQGIAYRITHSFKSSSCSTGSVLDIFSTFCILPMFVFWLACHSTECINIWGVFEECWSVQCITHAWPEDLNKNPDKDLSFSGKKKKKKHPETVFLLPNFTY